MARDATSFQTEAFQGASKAKEEEVTSNFWHEFPVYPLLDIYVQTYGIESVNFWCSKNLVHLTSYYIDKET